MVIKGQRGPHYQGRSIQRSPSQLTITDRWIGSEAEVGGLIFTKYHYVVVERIGNTPVWQATAQKQTGPNGEEDTAFHSFDLKVNTMQASTKNSPVLKTKLSEEMVTIVEAVYQRIRQEAAKASNPYKYSDGRDTLTAQLSGVYLGRGLELLDDRIAQVNSFFEFSHVFRWSATYNFATVIPMNYDNMARYYLNSAAMLAGEGVPTSLMTFGLPQKEWLVIPPQIERNYGGITEVTREYWAADAFSRLYYLAIGETLGDDL